MEGQGSCLHLSSKGIIPAVASTQTSYQWHPLSAGSSPQVRTAPPSLILKPRTKTTKPYPASNSCHPASLSISKTSPATAISLCPTTHKGSLKWAEHLPPEELLQGCANQPLPTILPSVHLLVHAVSPHRLRLGCCPPWIGYLACPRPHPSWLIILLACNTYSDSWLLKYRCP